MDSAHLHLMLNHVPIITTILSLLILSWGILKTDKAVINVGMAGFILAGIFSLIVFLSGSAAQSFVSTIEGISISDISEHQEMSSKANLLSMMLALISVAGFVVQKFKTAWFDSLKWAIVIIGLGSAGFFGYTAYLGGQIHHTEIPVTQAAEVESEDGFIEPCNEGRETLGDEFAQ